MLLPEKNIFSNKALKICATLLPRTAVLLVLLTQQPFLAHMFAGSSYGTLYALIIADLLICAAYVIITARAGRAAFPAGASRGETGSKNGHARPIIRALCFLPRKFSDALFFLYSLFAFYFIDYLSTEYNVFARNSSPYDNILLMLIIQVTCLGFFFTGFALRRVPQVLKKRPWLALALTGGICGASFAGRDPVLAPLLAVLNDMSQHVMVFAAVCYCLVLFFLLFVGLYGCYKKYIKPRTPLTVIVTVVSVIGLPLAILLTGDQHGTNSLFWSVDYLAPGLFRPVLQNNLFWGILFLLIAGLITAAHIKNTLVRRTLFILLGVSLPITLYACVVLLPFLSVIFVFVLFDPLFFLFFLPCLALLSHVRALRVSARGFKTVFAARPVTVRRLTEVMDRGRTVQRPAGSIGFARLTPRLKTLLVLIALICLLPGSVLLNAFIDKAELTGAYYGMDKSGQIAGIDPDRLRHVLEEFGSHHSNLYLPLITPARRAIILGDKTINKRHSARMRTFYLGEPYYDSLGRVSIRWPRRAHLEFMEEIAYAEHASYMQSKVLIRVGNDSGARDEFYARFELPAGVFITGLSLWIDDNERRGILTSKESALMVYESISRRLMDPALLRYEDDGSCSLRIFPVEPGQERHATVTFLYRKPFSLHLGGGVLDLGRGIVAETKRAAPKITGSQKQALHFIIDYSTSNMTTSEVFMKLVAACINKLDWHGPIRFTAANYNWRNYDSLDALFADRSLPRRGSFIYSRVLRGLLRDYEQSGEYPRFVFVSHEKERWYVHTSLAATKIRFPGLGEAYRLDTDGNLYKFPAFNITDEEEYGNVLEEGPVPEELTAPHASLLCGPRDFKEGLLGAGAADMNDWERNALLFTRWCGLDAEMPVNYGSRRSLNVLALQRGLLLPCLSYIVLENAEQEQMLEQASNHEGNGGLLRQADFETVSMDEGPDYIIVMILVLLAGLAVFAQWRGKRQREGNRRYHTAG